MNKFKDIDANEVRKDTLPVYLMKNYSVLSKRQLYEIASEYMKTVYLRDGHLHVVATNEMLENLGGKGDG